MTDASYTIGELAERTGLAPSALRYYEELGVMPRARRVSGQRRYDADAIASVGVVRLLRDVGFSLSEIKAFLRTRSGSPDSWREMACAKLRELDERIARAEAARTALRHAIQCRHGNLRDCPTFAGVLAATLEGAPLEQAHAH
jgi:DNA-binding transcriptional MerR regulator